MKRPLADAVATAADLTTRLVAPPVVLAWLGHYIWGAVGAATGGILGLGLGIWVLFRSLKL